MFLKRLQQRFSDHFTKHMYLHSDSYNPHSVVDQLFLYYLIPPFKFGVLMAGKGLEHGDELKLEHGKLEYCDAKTRTQRKTCKKLGISAECTPQFITT